MECYYDVRVTPVWLQSEWGTWPYLLFPAADGLR